jgi:hypothetical protein
MLGTEIRSGKFMKNGGLFRIEIFGRIYDSVGALGKDVRRMFKDVGR